VKLEQPGDDRTLLPALGRRFTATTDHPGNRMKGVVMKVRGTRVARAAGLAALLAGIALGTAVASPIKWIPVQLGSHTFGHVRSPDAFVVRAGPNQVGFKKGGENCGCLDGPQGPMLFDVGQNGSVWVLDILNHRLLAWKSGHAARPTRRVVLPNLDIRDFALGRDGTIYLYAVYAKPPAGDSGANLWALTPTGKVRWRAHAETGNALRLGPNGALYSIGASMRNPAGWTPLTTAAGRPLSLAAQRRGTTRFEPLPGGMHLVVSQLGVHEIHFALVDRSRKIVRAWRIRSTTPVALARRSLMPALVGRDLVTGLDVSKQVKGRFLSEHLVMRLSPNGTRDRFSLDGKAVWGDDGAETITELRIGSDSRLYQLRTNPKTGLRIASYTL
jgi:hypothetical protein